MAKPKTTRNFGLFRGAMEESGRDALFGVSSDFPRLLELDLARIRRNADQPRKHFDPDEMEALAQSIRRYGLKQPILVQEAGDGDYALVAGERRFRAHEMLGRSTIFAIVTTGDADELALVENVQRVDLNALELSEALARLMSRHGYTQEELGAVIGKSQSYVSHTLRLNSLPDHIKRDYATSHTDVSRSVMVEIAWIKDPAEQLAHWQRVIAGEGTVKAARERKLRPAPEAPRAIALFLTTVRLANKQISDVRPYRDHLDEKQVKELRRLRALIDEILDADG